MEKVSTLAYAYKHACDMGYAHDALDSAGKCIQVAGTQHTGGGSPRVAGKGGQGMEGVK